MNPLCAARADERRERWHSLRSIRPTRLRIFGVATGISLAGAIAGSASAQPAVPPIDLVAEVQPSDEGSDGLGLG
jgi:hypothetical protein